MNRKFIISLPVFCLLTGCASIISGSESTFIVDSEPTGAEFHIKNRSGISVFKSQTPTTVSLPSGAGFFTPERYTIEFTKNEYKPNTLLHPATINGWYFGNIIFGGVIGLFIVDPITGAMWKTIDKAYARLEPSSVHKESDTSPPPLNQSNEDTLVKNPLLIHHKNDEPSTQTDSDGLKKQAIKDKLKMLIDLRDNGTISSDEYLEKRKELIDSL